MKKKLSIFSIGTILAFIVSIIALPGGTAFAQYAEGTHDIPYEIKDSSGSSVSIADGYFTGTAKLEVENGVNYVHLTVKEADYVKDISGPEGSAQVVSEDKDANTKTLKLKVGDLSAPVELGMHIVVPEEIAGMEYDNHHTTQAIFDASGVPAPTAEKSNEDATKTDDDSTETVAEQGEENPPTGDNTPIALYVSLLIASIAGFAVYKFRFARN